MPRKPTDVDLIGRTATRLGFRASGPSSFETAGNETPHIAVRCNADSTTVTGTAGIRAGLKSIWWEVGNPIPNPVRLDRFEDLLWKLGGDWTASYETPLSSISRSAHARLQSQSWMGEFHRIDRLLQDTKAISSYRFIDDLKSEEVAKELDTTVDRLLRADRIYGEDPRTQALLRADTLFFASRITAFVRVDTQQWANRFEWLLAGMHSAFHDSLGTFLR